MDVQEPTQASSTMSGGQSSSQSTHDTFVGEDDDQEEIGPSQLQDAPLTQPSQTPGPRKRRPAKRFTPGTDALGKGKAKSRKK